MATNYMDVTTWKGYKCFKVQRDATGELFPSGGKYVAFRHGVLVGEYSTEKLAEVGFLKGDSKGTRLSDYLGIDVRLRGG